MNDDKVFTERQQFTEYEGKLVAAASDLGIAPGYWPATIVVEEAGVGIQTFTEHHVTQHLADGELRHYRNPETGTELVLFND